MSSDRHHHDLTCPACQLRFDSFTLLSLHREKFCLISERRSVTRSPVVENSVVAKESDGSKGTSDRKLGGMVRYSV